MKEPKIGGIRKSDLNKVDNPSQNPSAEEKLNNTGSFMGANKLQYTLIGMCFVNEKCID
jgi:hypothetical protein